MIEERSIGKMILLTFVTCGIYGIIWQLNIANDIKTLNGSDKPNGGMDILLTILTCGLYGIYVWYQYPTLLNQGLQHLLVHSVAGHEGIVAKETATSWIPGDLYEKLSRHLNPRPFTLFRNSSLGIGRGPSQRSTSKRSGLEVMGASASGSMSFRRTNTFHLGLALARAELNMARNLFTESPENGVQDELSTGAFCPYPRLLD